MRSLGLFVGHVARGFTQPLHAQAKARTSRRVEVRSTQPQAGGITLRRTTIEEIELPAGCTPQDLREACDTPPSRESHGPAPANPRT